MIIIGDEFIPYEKFELIKTLDDIKSTSSNSIVVFDFDKKILSYCLDNGVLCCVKVSTITQAVISNALESRYILTPKNILKEVQDIAQNYLFDSKVLVKIDDEQEIENHIKNNIDGVIYSTALNRG